MEKQFFELKEHGKNYIFESSINGEGYFIKGANTILGTIYSENGVKIGVQRVSWNNLTPLHYSYLKTIFPNFPKTN